jgi:predicted thioredoxin/glutaredoxin
MGGKSKVEVFSAGCALCHTVIDVVRLEAGSSSEVIVRDMMDARVLARAEKFGIRSVPAVVIDGKLASCCTGKGVDIQVLKSELGKTLKVRRREAA